MKTIIANGRIVMPDGVLNGTLTVDGGRITSVQAASATEVRKGSDVEEIDTRIDAQMGTNVERIDAWKGANVERIDAWKGTDVERIDERKFTDVERIDAQGCFVLPGLIDFHCDMLEHAVQPRKGVFFPVSLALQSLQSQYLAAGITAILHPVSFSGEPGLRSNEMADEIVHEIENFRRKECSLLRHFIHVRYELFNQAGLETLEKILNDGLAALFSVMDHSPGYTRFNQYYDYKNYVGKNSTLKGEALDEYVNGQWEKRFTNNNELQEEIIKFVKKVDIPFATHDDDSPGRFDTYRQYGAAISEFPLNEKTAAYVMKNNYFSVVGAPNLFRNRSHADNLSARAAVKNGMANIVCSDYYCFALLPSVFILFEEGMKLEEAVSLVSSNPARALGLSDRLGSLEPGKDADVILVSYEKGEIPFVKRAMVAGKWSFIS